MLLPFTLLIGMLGMLELPGHLVKALIVGSYCPENAAMSCRRCSITCANIDNQPDCDSDDKGSCKYQCYCNKGYYMNYMNRCVLPEDCQLCKANSTYNICGTACPITCANKDDPPKICDNKCVESCFCNKDFVLNEDGQCVPPEQCPYIPKCGKNQMIQKCPNECNSRQCPTNVRPPVCAFSNDCKPSICSCATFSSRMNKHNTCIPAKECPPFTCNGENEVYDSCPAHCIPTKCAALQLNNLCSSSFRLLCRPACVCRKGYIKNNNKCIKDTTICEKSGNFPRCVPNAERQNCGSACPLTCDNMDNPPKACDLPCYKGCFCKAGFYLTDDHRCVPANECPTKPKCGTNEIIEKCPTKCSTDRCPTRGGPQAICRPPKKCRSPACRCLPNYKRNKNNVCIAEVACTGSSVVVLIFSAVLFRSSIYIHLL